jgi:hypothetical protein
MENFQNQLKQRISELINKNHLCSCYLVMLGFITEIQGIPENDSDQREDLKDISDFRKFIFEGFETVKDDEKKSIEFIRIIFDEIFIIEEIEKQISKMGMI